MYFRVAMVTNGASVTTYESWFRVLTLLKTSHVAGMTQVMGSILPAIFIRWKAVFPPMICAATTVRRYLPLNSKKTAPNDVRLIKVGVHMPTLFET
ncbi:hypothetical protein TNCV_169151 [Trichonephila clavipes]|nr:hypothetical protein TNCV_169151 [Trichonephila clavipes]